MNKIFLLMLGSNWSYVNNRKVLCIEMFSSLLLHNVYQFTCYELWFFYSNCFIMLIIV